MLTEVERQLNNKPATTPQLPSKKQRNGSNSSAKHQHQLSDPISSSPRQTGAAASLDDSQPMLSTFGGRSASQPASSTTDLLTPGNQGLLTTKSTVVQLRRNTNKMGRQAPTPPKRTRWVITKLSIIDSLSHNRPFYSSFRDSTYTDADNVQDDDGNVFLFLPWQKLYLT